MASDKSTSVGSIARYRQKLGRKDAVLIFDPTQKVPERVLKAMVYEWLVPSLVEEFFAAWRNHRSNETEASP